MAKFNDGGGSSLGGNIGSAIGKIATAGTNAAKQQKKKNTAVSNAVRNVARSGTNAANRVAGQNNRARQSSGRGNSGRSGYSTQTTPRYSSPPRPRVGNTSGGVVTSTVPPAPPKFGAAYLAGDTTYGSQASALQKALQDYAAQYGTGLQNYNTEYTTSLDKLKQDQGLKSTELNDDFASRGLLTSGVYADALNKFNQQYDTQRADLARAKALYEQDALTDKNNFTTQNQLELEKARQAALQRYNDKYGL
ncbi:MAG TPA: hypothetical protein VIY48_13460 [Candidatus Paceibacterota bacterium]